MQDTLPFFFFQAEDGIRDTSVTGVQTCALPISRATVWVQVPLRPARDEGPIWSGQLPISSGWMDLLQSRSEERRVGKECRVGGWACPENKKEERNSVRRHGSAERQDVSGTAQAG